MASEFFGRQRECRFYTAGCGNKMAVSVTGPRAVNELSGPVIPGITDVRLYSIYFYYLTLIYCILLYIRLLSYLYATFI